MKKITIVLCLSSFIAQAQDHKWRIKAEYYKPINPFAVVNATPNGFHYPSNFGAAIGAERDYKNRKRLRTYQSFAVGFYNEVYFERVATLETNFGLNVRLFKGLNVGLEAGAGYNRATNTNLVSVYKDAKWVSKLDKSIVVNRVTPSLSFNIGYDFSKHFARKIPLSISFSKGGQLLYPYLSELDVPIGLMFNNKASLKYSIR